MESVDIAGILNSQGSIVSCVLLQATKPDVASTTSTTNTAISLKDPPDTLKSTNNISSSASSTEKESLSSNEETRISPSTVATDISNIPCTKTPPSDDSDNPEAPSLYPHAHLMSQISVDTTPKKRHVEQILGGAFTFLGQYDEIGVVVMALRPDLTIDKPNNPHVLPPPLNPGLINGDILLMRVSPAEDEDEESLGDDNVEEENTKTGLSSAAHKAGQSNSQDSDDFFQDFTCEEYLDFVERSANEPLAVVVDQTGEEEEGSLEQVEDTYHHSDEGWQDFEDDDEDDEEDGNYVAFDEEEEKVGMMNLIMGQILRKFREEHGRGPDTKELLQMRQALAMKLGVDVPAVWDDDDNNREETSDQDDEDDEDDEDKDKDLESKKRSADDALEKIEKRTAKKPKVRWSSEYQYKNIGLEPESFDEIEENEDESEQIQEIQQEA